MTANHRLHGRVLIVAGSDSSGGAGIQADLKTVTALGAYGMTAITALTVQDTRGVHRIVGVSPPVVTDQMTACLDDIGADAIKTGMLHSTAVVKAVLAGLDHAPKGCPLVVDPVMVAKGGASLLKADTVAILKTRLIPRASVITPNLPEAEALLGRPIGDLGAMEGAALALRALGCAAVLLKGGHLPGDQVWDVLAGPDGLHHFDDPRIVTRHSHGTGCTLASALAAGLAQGLDLVAAVTRARAYVRRALLTAPGFGHGHGPLNHAHTVAPFEG